MRRNDLTSDEARFERLMQTLDREAPAPDAEFLRTLRESSTRAFLVAQGNRPQPSRRVAAAPANPAQGRRLLRVMRIAMLTSVAVLLVAGFLPGTLFPSRGVELQVAMDNLRRNDSLEIEVRNGNMSNMLLYLHENGQEKLAFTFPSGNMEVFENGVALFVNDKQNSSHPSLADGIAADLNANPVEEKLMASLNVNDPQVKAMLFSQRPQSQLQQDGEVLNNYTFQTPAAMYEGQTLTVNATVNASTNSLVAMNSKVTDARGNIQFQANAAVTGVNRDIPARRLKTASGTEQLEKIATVEEVQGSADVVDLNLPVQKDGSYANNFADDMESAKAGARNSVDSTIAMGDAAWRRAPGKSSAGGYAGNEAPSQAPEMAKGRYASELAELEQAAQNGKVDERIFKKNMQAKDRPTDEADAARRSVAAEPQDAPHAPVKSEDQTHVSRNAQSKAPAGGPVPPMPSRSMPQKELRVARPPVELAPPAPVPAPPAPAAAPAAPMPPGAVGIQKPKSMPAQAESEGAAGAPAPDAVAQNAPQAKAGKGGGSKGVDPAPVRKGSPQDSVESKSLSGIQYDRSRLNNAGSPADKSPETKLGVSPSASKFRSPTPTEPLEESFAVREESREMNRNIMPQIGQRQELPLRQFSYQMNSRFGNETPDEGMVPYGIVTRQAEANSELRPRTSLKTPNQAANVVRARMGNDAVLYVGPGSDVMLMKANEVQLRFGELALDVPKGDQVDLLGPESETVVEPESPKSNYRRAMLPLRRQVTGRGYYRVENNQIQEVPTQPDWLTNYFANESQQSYQKRSPQSANKRIQTFDESAPAGPAKASAPKPASDAPSKK